MKKATQNPVNTSGCPFGETFERHKSYLDRVSKSLMKQEDRFELMKDEIDCARKSLERSYRMAMVVIGIGFGLVALTILAAPYIT